MKRSLKDVKDHNNKSGNDKKTHPFQNELDVILKTKPTISPVATASSSSSTVCEESGKEKSAKREMKRKHQLDEKSNEEESTSKTRHTRVPEVVLFLKSFAGKK